MCGCFFLSINEERILRVVILHPFPETICLANTVKSVQRYSTVFKMEMEGFLRLRLMPLACYAEPMLPAVNLAALPIG